MPDGAILHQWPWFRVVAGALLVLLLALLYLLRVRHLTARAAAHMHARLLERERIAGELHDTLLQGIHALLLQMQSVLQGLSDEQARQAMEAAIEQAEQAVAQARDRIAGLRDTMNLPDNLFAALRVLATALSANGQTEVRVSLVGVQQPLHLDVRDEVLYIAREAIVNALRHAGAQRVNVTVEFSPRGFALVVEDDGRGLPPEVSVAGSSSGHYGLPSMGERARRVGGRLEVDSTPGAGTVVSLSIPRHAALRRYDRRSKWRMRWRRMVHDTLLRRVADLSKDSR